MASGSWRPRTPSTCQRPTPCSLQPGPRKLLKGSLFFCRNRYFLFSSRTLKQKYVDAGGEPTDYRDAGIGGTLIEKIMGEARARGAKNMYISSANSQHTVEFYMRKGAVQAKGEQVQEIPNAGFAGTQDIQLIRPL